MHRILTTLLSRAHSNERLRAQDGEHGKRSVIVRADYWILNKTSLPLRMAFGDDLALDSAEVARACVCE